MGRGVSPGVRMRRTAGAIAAAALAASCSGASAIAPPLEPAMTVEDAPLMRGPFGQRVAEVVFHAGLLWVRGAGGGLAAFDPMRGQLRRHLANEHVVAIHGTAAGGLWALTVHGESDDVRIFERGAHGWNPIAEMAAPTTPLLALADVRGRPVVLAPRSVFAVDGHGRLQGTALDAAIVAAPEQHVPFAVTDDGVGYVAAHSDEVEGALYRIELLTGRVETMPRADGGPGDGSAGDTSHPGPVTAIVRDPDQRGCVLVGVGLSDTGAHGRLLRACDRTLSVAWESPRPPRDVLDARLALAPFRGTAPRPLDGCAIDPAACRRTEGEGLDDAGRGDEAVLGLSATRDGIWLVTDAALYRWRAPRFERQELPPLSRQNGLAIGQVRGGWVVAADASSRPSHGDEALVVVAAPDTGDPPAVAPRAAPPPLGTCWGAELEGPHDRTVVLCFAEDRFFAADERGFNSGLMAWRRGGVSSWSLDLASGETMRLRVDRDGIVVHRSTSSGARAAKLRRIDPQRALSLRAEIDALPRVEAVCEKARTCAELAAAPSDVSRGADLRSCKSSLAWTSSTLARHPPPSDADAAAWRACRAP